jgi:hypothetical protein
MVFALFVALSIIWTYPLVANLSSTVLGAPAPGDNFEYVYKTWWFKHALFDLHVSPLFNPAMFYPFGYNVAFSETTTANLIPALPATLLLGEVVSYNLLILLSFALSGLGMYLLVLHLTGSRAAGLLSGIVFAFTPYRIAHLAAGHLPLSGTQWLPLLLLYLDRMIVRQSWRDALLAALFYSLGALSSWYYMYMFALAGLAYVLLRGRPWRQHLWQRKFARAAVVFVAATLVIVGPMALPLAQSLQEGERPASLRYLDQYSASPLDFLYPNVLHPWWGPSLLGYYQPNIHENVLYVGWVAVGLALYGLWRRREPVPRAIAWLSLIFGVMALGLTLHWGRSPLYLSVPPSVERVFTVGMNFLTERLALHPTSSWSLRVAGAVYLPMPTLLLYLYLPFFSAMRVWSRLGLVAIFGVAVLAGYGLVRLRQRLVRRSPRSAPLFIAILLGLVILDLAAFPFTLGWSQVKTQPVYAWLADQPDDVAVMMYPTIRAIGGLPVYSSLVQAGKKIVFGYGTFFPRAFNEQRPVLETFPADDAIALLRDWDVRYVLVSSGWYGQDWPDMQARLAASGSLHLVGAFDEEPVYSGDRVLRSLPEMQRAFIVDRTWVYEIGAE